MKRILICSHAMEIGGAERSLLDLLHCMDYSRVQVDLFLYRHTGEWMNSIPKKVHLLPEIPQYACLAVPMTQVLKKRHLGVLAGRIKGRKKAQKYDKTHQLKDSVVGLEYSHKYTCRYMPLIQPGVEYDLAISFLTPHYFVAEKVRAKKRIAWIHTDYSFVNLNVESERKMWSKYEYIASISDSCKKGFISCFPELENRIISIENVLAEQTVWKQSEQDVSDEMPEENGVTRLLSVGRFSYAKNFDQLPEICSLIRKKGHDVLWYLIGYGDDTPIRQNIEKFGMENYVIILGKKENPYPYIRACDVYIQPSRYEGKSVTVREAQMLHKPVIITRYPTSASQLKEGFDGVIVPQDNAGCAEGIAQALSQPELLQTVAANTKKEDYSNRTELEKIYALAEGKLWN